MHIVLLILKILLIIVLSLIGIVVLLALLVLFAPVRYKLYARKQEDIWAKFTATWLGFVLCFKMVYDQSDGLDYRLRLFGGTLFGSEKNKKGDGTDKEGFVEHEPVHEMKTGSDEKETSFEQEFPSADNEDREFLLEDKEFEYKTEGILGRIGRRLDAVCRSITEKYKSISEKIAGLKKKKDGYTKLVNNVRTKEAIRVVKVQLVALLKHLKPSKLKGQIVYGTGDPASTGQHLGYMSVLFPLYYDHIDITPDFEQKRLEGDLMAKGYIRIWTVGLCVLKVIWNKNVKITMSRFKKISGGN